MALDLSPASIVRASSGLLYLLTGLFIAVAGRRRTENLLLGSGFALFGCVFVGNNLLGLDEETAPATVAITSGLGVASAACVSALSFRLEPDRRTQPGMVALLFASVAFVVWLAWIAWPHREVLTAEFGFPRSAARNFGVLALSVSAISAGGALLGVAAIEGLRRDVPRARASYLASLAIPAYGSFSVGQLLAGGGPLARHVLPGFLLSLIPVFWALRATEGPHGRLARNGILALAGAAILGLPFSSNVDDHGAIGILRILFLAPVFWAIFRLDLLGVPLRHRTLRRGSLASAGLAALFITAQVAQNFLSDAYGLLVGGVVAGAVVFAAFPLQRAAERALERRPRKPEAASERYRRLVATAWRDGRLGANERLLLAEARRQLGLDLETAAAVDEKVAAGHAQAGRRPAKPRRRSPEPL